MSSILKALKKLEDEYPRQAGGKPVLPRTPGVKKTLRRWEINSGRFAPVLWAVLAVIVLAAAGWFLIYMQTSDKPPVSSAGLPKGPQRSIAEQRQPVGSTSRSASADRRSSGATMAAGRTRPIPPAATQAEPTPAAAARAQKKSPPAVTARPPVAGGTDSPPEAQLPVLQSELELQAVSWAPSPANRIAVINGSILREGGSIEGFSVIRIEEQEVVVRKGLSQWRLVFNLKK